MTVSNSSSVPSVSRKQSIPFSAPSGGRPALPEFGSSIHSSTPSSSDHPPSSRPFLPKPDPRGFLPIRTSPPKPKPKKAESRVHSDREGAPTTPPRKYGSPKEVVLVSDHPPSSSSRPSLPKPDPRGFPPTRTSPPKPKKAESRVHSDCEGAPTTPPRKYGPKEVVLEDANGSPVRVLVHVGSSPSRPGFSVRPSSVSSPMCYHHAKAYENLARSSASSSDQIRKVKKFLRNLRRPGGKAEERLVTLMRSPPRLSIEALRRLPVEAIHGPHVRVETERLRSKRKKTRRFSLHNTGKNRLFPVGNQEDQVTLTGAQLIKSIDTYQSQTEEKDFYSFVVKRKKRKKNDGTQSTEASSSSECTGTLK